MSDRADTADRAEAVAAMRRELPSFRWRSQIQGGSVEIHLPGHRPIRFAAAKRVSWRKRGKTESSLYEPATVFALSILLRRLDIGCVFDIGAAEGYLSLVAASPEERPPSVHAFEMAPPRFAAMQRNLTLNSTLAVTPHNVGVSDRPLGRVPVWHYKNDLYLRKPPRSEYDEGFIRNLKYHLRGRRDLIRLHTAEIEIESIDSFCRREGVSPGLVKIDVDGFEARVLPGGCETFAATQPLVLLELHREKLLSPHAATRRGIVELMLGFGYRALLIEGHNKLSRTAFFDLDAARLERLDRNMTDLVLFY